MFRYLRRNGDVDPIKKIVRFGEVCFYVLLALTSLNMPFFPIIMSEE